MVLKIKNFQSIEYAELELEGFTILEGKSNQGKSSVRRALAALLYNEWDKSYIQEGKKTATLELTDKDFLIRLVKGTQNSYYVEYNGQAYNYDKIGRDVPEIVQEIGFKYLNTTKASYDIHISKQPVNEPLFLVSFTDTENTQIFNSVFNVGKYEEASRLVMKDLSKVRLDVNYLEESIQDYDSRLEALEDKRNVVNEALELVNSAEDINIYLENTGLQSDLNERIDETVTAIKLLNRLYALTNFISLKISQGEKNTKISQLQIKLDKYIRLEEQLHTIDSLPMLEQFINASKNSIKVDRQLSKTIETIEVLTNTLEETSQVIQSIKSIVEYVTEIQYRLTLQEQIETNKHNLLKVDEKIKVTASVCPTCGQSILNHGEH